MTRELRARLFLLAGSAIVALILAELGLRIVHRLSYDSPLPWGIRDEQSGRIGVVRLTKNFVGRKEALEYRTNSDRWRDDEVDPAKNHIVFLGDSCTFGLNVAHEQTYPEQVESLLGDAFQSVNTATPGQGTLDQEEIVTNLLKDPRFKIKAVVVGFYSNDIGECVSRVMTKQDGARSILRRIRLLRVIRGFFQVRRGELTTETIQSGAPSCYAALARIASLGVPLLVVILPENERDILSSEERPWRQDLKAFLQKSNIRYIDARDSYRKVLSDRATLPASFYSSPGDAGHPGPGACEIIASEVVRQLRADGVVPTTAP